MRDATVSAVSGRTPSFSDDDVQLLTDDPPPTLAFAISLPDLDTSDPVNSRKKPFWTIFGS